LGQRATRLEARYHPEGEDANSAGVCREGHASYPGKSVSLPLATGMVRGWQMAAEVVVAAETGAVKDRTCHERTVRCAL